MSANANANDSGSSGAVAALVSSLSVSVLGYNLLQNPEGFVLAVVYQAVVDAAVGTAGEIGLILIQIFEILQQSVIGGVGAAIRLPFELVGGIILSTLGLVQSVAVFAASAAGPLAFVAVPVVWAVATLTTAALLIGAFRIYRWIRTVVV